MQIFIKCPTQPLDWFIIELQGEVGVEGSGEPINLQGVTFANLSEIDGKPILRIGKHELRGGLVKLEKPLAVLQKSIQDADSAMEVTETDLGNMGDAPSVSYEVIGVVRSKYLFKDRPKVILDVH